MKHIPDPPWIADPYEFQEQIARRPIIEEQRDLAELEDLITEAVHQLANKQLEKERKRSHE